MVVFEGKAFNEKQVTRIIHVRGQNDEIILYLNSYSPQGIQENIRWTFPNTKIVITKINELTTLINQREEALLKLTNS